MSLNTGNAILSNAITVDSSYNVSLGGNLNINQNIDNYNTLRFRNDNNAGAYLIAFDKGGADKAFIQYSNQNETLSLFSVSDNGNMKFYVGNNAALQISSLYNGANVGIGGAPSTEKLKVTGSLAVTGGGTFYLGDGVNGTYFLGGAGNTARQLKFSTSTTTNIGDTHTIDAQSGTGNLVFAVTSAERMRITSNGNVGIGTSSPGSLLSLEKAKSGSGVENIGILSLRLTGTTAIGDSLDVGFYNGTNVNIANIKAILGGDNVAYGSLAFYTRNYFTDTSVENMRINNRGQILIGKTADAMNTAGILFNTTGTSVYSFAITNNESFILNNITTGTSYKMDFRTNSISRGNINVTDTATTYNTGSDYRLKQDFKDFNGLDLVKNIKTYDFEWKIDNSRMYGFIAHELAEVLPYAVQGEKDGENMQSVDYSKLTPLLVKAIQEMNTKIDQQQQTINSLINR